MTAYLGLGSNMGDREDNLRRAIEAIGQMPCTSIEAVSSVIETEPLGEWERDDGNGAAAGEKSGEGGRIGKGGRFLNCCIRIGTGIPPRRLLRMVKEIETTMGRAQRPIKKNEEGQRIYSDRPIDIDILLYGRRVVNDPDLQIPHPRMTERDFLMQPLREILPGGLQSA